MSTSNTRLLITTIVVFLPSLAFVLGIWQLWQQQVSGFDLGLLAVMYVLTLIGVEGGFHRLISHRAFKTTDLIRNFFVVAASMASQGPVIFWVATHRKHHAFTDKDGDPHSPILNGAGWLNRLRGLAYGHCGWLFGADTADWPAYAGDLVKDPGLLRLNLWYPWWVLLGLLLPALAGGLYDGTLAGAGTGLLWGGLIRIFLVHHAVWSVNSVCHVLGSQPFKTGGNSKNNLLLALPTAGGAWHNNHHAFPRTPNNAFKWWQLDVTGMLIDALASVGLAWDLHKVSKASQSNRQKVDRANLHSEEV